MSSIKKVLLLLLGILLLFISYLTINTLTFKSKQVKYDPIKNIEINSEAKYHLSEALQIQTVSNENPAEFDSTEFKRFADFLERTYPFTNAQLEKKVFNSYSFLYKWEGSDANLKPIILMAHLDVVPVIEENLPNWKHAPFGGEIVNDTIWGRGAIDDKGSVISIMESVEYLLKNGFTPKRSIYISFGHDEEIGGKKGAQAIATYLTSQNINAEFILDEGGTFVQGIVPGIEKEVALVGIAEKGFLTLELSVNIEGGHSSMPERETAIDVLASAVSKLKNNPFPAKISKPIEGFIDYLGPEMPFFNKMAFANKSIFRPVIVSVYEKSASGNALIRTTTSPTIFKSGVKENIIPQYATASINFRIAPETSIESVIDYVEDIMDDERIGIKTGNFNSEAYKVSSTDSFGFKTLQRTIAETNPDVLFTPYLVIGATDSRFFENVSNNIYRFFPIKITPENIKSFHGINERVPVAEFENSIRFYTQLIKNSTNE
ncbi:MAG: carboxypeptidase PM20D1 [Spirosomataceae bacterium]|jgi:carboxypeptidase PM20D1